MEKKNFRIKKKFAFFPKLIHSYYIWLECYYIKQRRIWDHWHALWVWDNIDYTDKKEYLEWKKEQKMKEL